MSKNKSFFARFSAIIVLCAVFAALIASAPQAAQKAAEATAVAEGCKMVVGQEVVCTGKIAELNNEFFLQLPHQETYYSLKGLKDFNLNGAEVVVKGVVVLENASEAVIDVHEFEVLGGNQPASGPTTVKS